MITILYTIVSTLSAIATAVTILGWFFYIVIITLTIKYTYAKRYPTAVPIIVAATIGTIIGSVSNFLLGLDSSMFAVTGVLLALCGTVGFLRLYEQHKRK